MKRLCMIGLCMPLLLVACQRPEPIPAEHPPNPQATAWHAQLLCPPRQTRTAQSNVHQAAIQQHAAIGPAT